MSNPRSPRDAYRAGKANPISTMHRLSKQAANAGAETAGWIGAFVAVVLLLLLFFGMMFGFMVIGGLVVTLIWNYALVPVGIASAKISVFWTGFLINWGIIILRSIFSGHRAS